MEAEKIVITVAISQVWITLICSQWILGEPPYFDAGMDFVASLCATGVLLYLSKCTTADTTRNSKPNAIKKKWMPVPFERRVSTVRSASPERRTSIYGDKYLLTPKSSTFSSTGTRIIPTNTNWIRPRIETLNRAKAKKNVARIGNDTVRPALRTEERPAPQNTQNKRPPVHLPPTPDKLPLPPGQLSLPEFSTLPIKFPDSKAVSLDPQPEPKRSVSDNIKPKVSAAEVSYKASRQGQASPLNSRDPNIRVSVKSPAVEDFSKASNQQQARTSNPADPNVRVPEKSSPKGEPQSAMISPTKGKGIARNINTPLQNPPFAPQKPKHKSDVLGLPIILQTLRVHDIDIIPIPSNSTELAEAKCYSLEDQEAEITMQGAVNGHDVLTPMIPSRKFQQRADQDDMRSVHTVELDNLIELSGESEHIQPWRLVPLKQLSIESLFYDPAHHMDWLKSLCPEAWRYYTTRKGQLHIEAAKMRADQTADGQILDRCKELLTSGKRELEVEEVQEITQLHEACYRQCDRQVLQAMIKYGGIFPTYDHTCYFNGETRTMVRKCHECRVKYPEDLEPLRVNERYQWDEDEAKYWNEIWEQGKNTWDRIDGFEGLYKM